MEIVPVDLVISVPVEATAEAILAALVAVLAAAAELAENGRAYNGFPYT